MEEQYFRLWVLLREKVARKSMLAKEYVSEKEILHKILEEMAILEAEAILGGVDMVVKVKDLEIGQVIRFEFGDYDNRVKGTVQAVSVGEKYVDVTVDFGSRSQDVCFQLSGSVEVIND